MLDENNGASQKISEIGSGIQLGENAINVLQSCGLKEWLD